MKLIKARAIVDGTSQTAEAIFSQDPIAFLHGVDPEKGIVSDQSSRIYDVPFSRKILIFPNAVGSSVGAYVIYRLKKNRKAPKAIVNQSADIITISGCAIAGIPLYDLPENKISELKGARKLSINAKNSELRFEE
jgi:predicted aconitase with swiveling domain